MSEWIKYGPTSRPDTYEIVDIWVKAKNPKESGRFTNMCLTPEGKWHGRNLYSTDVVTHFMRPPPPPKGG